MNSVGWEGASWFVQLRDDDDDELAVRIAINADVKGDDATWIPLAEFRQLIDEISHAEPLLSPSDD